MIAPLSAPAILALSRGDYTILFAIAGTVAVLGSLALVPMKLPPAVQNLMPWRWGIVAVLNLKGGILDWIDKVDPSQPKY